MYHRQMFKNIYKHILPIKMKFSPSSLQTCMFSPLSTVTSLPCLRIYTVFMQLSVPLRGFHYVADMQRSKDFIRFPLVKDLLHWASFTRLSKKDFVMTVTQNCKQKRKTISPLEIVVPYLPGIGIIGILSLGTTRGELLSST